MDCFICKTFLSVNVMSKHFKLVHNLSENATYRCTFDNCFQFFGTISTLLKHLKSHLRRSVIETHDITPVVSYGSINQTATDNLIATTSNINSLQFLAAETAVLNDLSESSSSSIEQPKDELPCGSAVAFALELHNNNNFSRKDVITIQSNVIQNIVQPIIQKFEEFIKNNFTPEIEQTIALSSLLQDIKHPFKNCDTDYKLRE